MASSKKTDKSKKKSTKAKTTGKELTHKSKKSTKAKSTKPVSKAKPKSKLASKKSAKVPAAAAKKSTKVEQAPVPAEKGQVPTDAKEEAVPKENFKLKHENRFSQQRIPACTPLLTVGSAIPFFVLFAVSFVIIGVMLLLTNEYAMELRWDYTTCTDYRTLEPCYQRFNQLTNGSNSSTFPISKSPCVCHITASLTHGIPWNVFLYYGIENMYQSYLPYSESVDDQQMYGRLNGTKGACGELTARNGTPYAPCGLMANSLFNDTIELYRVIEHPTKGQFLLRVPLFRTGITWTPKYAVKNPLVPKTCPAGEPPLKCAFNGTIPPPNWQRHIWELDPTDPENNGYANEHLQSWLRFAPFRSFRRLYGRVDHLHRTPAPNKEAVKFFNKELPNGTYVFSITYNYPVTLFGGNKSVILSNSTWLGGKSPFLAYLYLLGAVICLVLLVIFYAIDRKFGKLSNEVYSFLQLRQSQRVSTKLTSKSYN